TALVCVVLSVCSEVTCCVSLPLLCRFILFFINYTATPEIYTLSLHDALPIWRRVLQGVAHARRRAAGRRGRPVGPSVRGSSRMADRKSTRLNSSHQIISYAVFCLKKKKKISTIGDA